MQRHALGAPLALGVSVLVQRTAVFVCLAGRVPTVSVAQAAARIAGMAPTAPHTTPRRVCHVRPVITAGIWVKPLACSALLAHTPHSTVTGPAACARLGRTTPTLGRTAAVHASHARQAPTTQRTAKASAGLAIKGHTTPTIGRTAQTRAYSVHPAQPLRVLIRQTAAPTAAPALQAPIYLGLAAKTAPLAFSIPLAAYQRHDRQHPAQ